jgi:hypothetical protein
MGVPASRRVTLGEEQHVVAQRSQPSSAQRAGVRGRLEVLSAPELPPARPGGHVSVVVVVGAGGTGQVNPVPDFSVRQLLETTFARFRARATLSTSLETVTT